MIIILNISIDFKFIYCNYITEKKKMGKILIEIRKGIAIGLLLTSFYASLYGIKEYIYNLKTKFEEINSYRYKWSENKKSTFVKRNLGYKRKISETAIPEEIYNKLRIEYCDAVKEIKKVDRKIVPGTNIPFKKATYTQVDDAYKEYLQKIAQIEQVAYDAVAFQDYIKCKYEETEWNKKNSMYRIPIFYSLEDDNKKEIKFYRTTR